MKLYCQKCGKRVSRRTARLIGGKVMCSTCMFAPRDSGRLPKGEDSRSEAECEASQSGLSDSEGIAQPSALFPKDTDQ